MNIIYIHICCITNYKDVFEYLILSIKESGLYDVIEEIRCCILGTYDASLFTDPKIKIHATSENIKLYEVFTINKIHEDSKTEKMVTYIFFFLFFIFKAPKQYLIAKKTLNTKIMYL